MNTATSPECGVALSAGAPASLGAGCLLQLGESTGADEDPTQIDSSPSAEGKG